MWARGISRRIQMFQSGEAKYVNLRAFLRRNPSRLRDHRAGMKSVVKKSESERTSGTNVFTIHSFAGPGIVLTPTRARYSSA
jgi:hypothetical protein